MSVSWDRRFCTAIIKYDGPKGEKCLRKKCMHQRKSLCGNNIVRGSYVWWISLYEYGAVDEHGYQGQFCHLCCLNEGWIGKILATNPPEEPTLGLIALDDARELLTFYVDGMDAVREAFGDDVVDGIVEFYVKLVELCEDKQQYELQVPLHKKHTRATWPGFRICSALDNAQNPLALPPPVRPSQPGPSQPGPSRMPAQ